MNADETRLAGGPLDEVDLEILARLSDALDEADPVPEHLAGEIKTALTWAALDAELAEITDLAPNLRADHEGDAEAKPRHAGVHQQPAWPHGPGVGGAGSTRIDGWVTGGGVLAELHVAGRVLPLESDAHGRPGPASRTGRCGSSCTSRRRAAGHHSAHRHVTRRSR